MSMEKFLIQMNFGRENSTTIPYWTRRIGINLVTKLGGNHWSQKKNPTLSPNLKSVLTLEIRAWILIM